MVSRRWAGHVLPRWGGLVRYYENGALSIHNNLSERSVRPVSIVRKNYLFMGSDNGEGGCHPCIFFVAVFCY